MRGILKLPLAGQRASLQPKEKHLCAKPAGPWQSLHLEINDGDNLLISNGRKAKVVKRRANAV